MIFNWFEGSEIGLYYGEMAIVFWKGV